MAKWKMCLRGVAFFALFAMLFVNVQELLTPDWDLPEGKSRSAKAARGVYNEPADTLQVLWLGSSHMQSGVSPMRIYEKTGIRSYNLATTAQPLMAGFDRLKYVLKSQSPKVVMLGVSGFFHGEIWQGSLPAWRRMIDTLPWYRFAEKLDETLDLISLSKSFTRKSVMSGVLPLLYYHDRRDLNRYDFMDRGFELPYHQKGQAVVPLVVAAKKKDLTETNQDSADKLEIFDRTAELLYKYHELCRQHGCELVLTMPPINKPTSYAGYWSRGRHDLIQKAADELGIRFIDLNFNDVGIDWKTDSWDGGGHMNLMGAQKVSDFYADWLSAEFGFEDNASDALRAGWDLQLEVYRYENERLRMLIERDVERYLDLASREGYTLFTLVSPSQSGAWAQELESQLERATERYLLDGAARIVVSSGGVALDTRGDNLRAELPGALPDGTPYSLSVEGSGEDVRRSVSIDGSEYAQAGPGIQLVVYDNDLHLVVDSAQIVSDGRRVEVRHSNADLQDALSEALIEYELRTLRSRAIPQKVSH